VILPLTGAAPLKRSASRGQIRRLGDSALNRCSSLEAIHHKAVPEVSICDSALNRCSSLEAQGITSKLIVFFG